MSGASTGGSQRGLTLLKLGGELLEPSPGLALLVQSVRKLTTEGPLVIVHGAGREIDAETERRGVPKQAVDGLRITDAATLDAVIAVLAGTVNTRLVAALVAVGLPAVGLTGVDAAIGLSDRALAHRSVDGRLVDLGLVGQPVVGGGHAGGGVAGAGQPAAGGGRAGGGQAGGGFAGGGHAGGGQQVASGGPPRLLADLVSHGYVPVIACLGIDPTGQVLNVNADTLAAALAAGCRARRLIFAGATAGVLDGSQSTLATLDEAGIDRMIADGSASAGMVAKLRACRDALHGGVQEIAIVSGRHADGFPSAPGTRIVAHAGAGASTT